MNPFRRLVIVLACAGCSPAEVPLDVHLVETPKLLVDVPARLLLDVRVGVPTSGVEITVEGGPGLRVVDYAPKVLPASQPTAGSQLFVDVLPQSAGDRMLTVRLTIHLGGGRVRRLVGLPLGVSSPPTAPQALERAVGALADSGVYIGG